MTLPDRNPGLSRNPLDHPTVKQLAAMPYDPMVDPTTPNVIGGTAAVDAWKRLAWLETMRALIRFRTRREEELFDAMMNPTLPDYTHRDVPAVDHLGD